MLSANYGTYVLNKKSNKGFTFVELLVVVAIVGVLLAVVLSSTQKSRHKADDVAIQQSLETIRESSVIYRDNNNNYGSVGSLHQCVSSGDLFDYPTIKEAINNAASHSTNGKLVNEVATCMTSNSNGGSLANSWAVSVILKSDPLKSWCVDSRGRSMIGSATIDTSGVSLCM